MFLVLSLAACRRDSPPADPEFSDALAYLFASFDQASEAELAYGLRDLEKQIRQDMDLTASNPVERSVIPAYLTEADVADIERTNKDHPLTAALPVAVGYRSGYPVPRHAELQLMRDQTPIEPYSPEHYDRNLVEGGDCFRDRGCDVLRTENDLTKENPIMTLDYLLYKDFQWVDLGLPDPSDADAEPGEERLAVVARSWTDRSYEGRGGNTWVHQSFTVEVWIPDGGGSIRLQSLWAETEIQGLPMTDDGVTAITRNGIDDIFGVADEYLAEH